MTRNEEILKERLDGALDTLRAVRDKIETPPPVGTPPSEWIVTTLRDVVDTIDNELAGPPVIMLRDE